MDLLRRSKLGTLVGGGLDSAIAVVDSFWRYPNDPPQPSTVQDGDSIFDVVTIANNTPSSLHALVIGINDYPNLPPLAGAVSDANSVYKFLTQDIGILPAQIINLRNSEASRAGIIQAFKTLQENEQITDGTPILIYFAGHGGVGPASDEWKQRNGASDKVQVIFPYDYYMGCEGNQVNCLPDKTVARLLDELAKVKGNNITVIFDSCHSASANRGADGRRPRSAAVKLAIPVNIDDDIFPPTPNNTSSSLTECARARHTDPLLCSHLSSHTYLAACGSNEQAWETSGLGAFTAALLKRIRTCGVDKITYHDLIKGFPSLDNQTPHCYGVNQSRILFNACVPPRYITYIPVIYDPTGRTLTLQAGVASGVTEGSVWEVRENTAEGSRGIIGSAKSVVVGTSSADLTPEESTGGDLFWTKCESGTQWEGGKKKLYARQIKSGSGNELKVWFSLEAKRLVFPEPGTGATEKPSCRDHEVGYVVVSERERAEIAVELYRPGGMGEGHHLGSVPGSCGPGTESEVVFHLCDRRAREYGVATLRQRKPARRADVETVLFAAARWNWHLHRTNQASTQAEIEMFKIAERKETSSSEWGFVAERERVLQKDGLVDFEVNGKDMYAFKLRSRQKAHLHVWMFYFDTTTFDICKLFGHSIANSRVDPNIFSEGEFVIGDGGEGDAPIPFKLDPGEQLDLGYVKVFWSTEPLELDHLVQGSAFERKVGACSRRPDNLVVTSPTEWGSTLLTLVQRAPNRGSMYH